MVDASNNQHRGACHCGAIGFHYRTSRPPAQWSVRACQCSFCRAHGALSSSDPAGSIEFFGAEEALQRYRFGLRTADFFVCRRCGVYVGAAIAVGERHYGIVNVRAIDLSDDQEFSVSQPVSYDGEDTPGRVARRAERWTPVNRLP